MSTPAVVFSLGFTYDWAIGGYDFLEYMDRPEAFDKTRHLNDEYKDFIDYMSNSEKSDGLFNAQSDLLTESDKEKYRQLETVSRDAGCPKYYGVVSFDNNFLIENGLMTSDGKLDVHGIKELGREGINAMISTSYKLDNDNVYWTGAIHTNTDNIHIHFSICEYERREDRCKVYRDKDCIEVKAFDKLKSKIVNRVLGSDYSRQLTELERESIKPALSSGYGGCAEQLIRLADKLPSEGGWQYGRPKMRAYRDDIDKTVDAVIASDQKLSGLWKQYNEMLDSRTEYLRKIYGEGERHLYATFKPNRLADFHKELGNQLLNDLAPLTEQLRASALPQAHPPENEMWFDEPPIIEANLYPYPQEFHPSEKETEASLRIEWTDRYKQALDLMYGSRTADGKELPKDLPAALELLSQESDSRNVLATYDLGKLYHIMSDENNDHTSLSEQNYKAALDGFQKLLDKQTSGWQHSYICYRVGKMYDKGLGTVQDYKAAREYYEKAGENRFAYFSLGNMYKFGSGVEVDMTMAVSYYEKALACKGDMPFASYALGQAYELGQGVKADEQKAAQHYTQALTGFTAIYEKSHEDSISYRLGTMYLKGKGTDVDLAKAEKYLLESADNGNNQAQYQLGKLRLAQDRIDEAEQLFVKSAEKGNVYSAFSLGRIYMTEEKRDDSKAEQFLKQYLAGSDDELGIGEYALGKLYLSQDRIDEAEQLFIKSAEKGNAYSAFSLGRIYMTEEKRDDSKAEQFLKQYLAGSDDELGIGEYALGKLYLSQDRIDEAEQLFISSSEKENLYASYKLGKLYLTDRKLDYTKAVKYLKPCADKADNEYAQYALGCIYLKKEHYDRRLAEKYLLESSGHNNSSAQLKLGLMYREEQKYRQSDYWMKLAAQNGNEYAQKILAERHEQIRMKLHLGATANSVMRRVCINMQTKAQQLLAQVERDEQEQKYKQAISQTYSR